MSSGLQLHQVEMVYVSRSGTVRAVGPITFDVLPGEFLCMVGESGCGKSTVLRLLAGLERPTSGEIRANGALIEGPSHRRGVVFQQPALFPWLTVRKNVEVGFKLRHQPIPHQEVQDTIEMVGLKGFENTYPRALSGGMQQRAAIARALVNSPDVMLLDEPFSALDAITRLRMQREVTRIWQEQHLTVVFVTHDMDEAVMLGTRILLMTPRPGRVARVFQVPLPFPRSPRSAEVQRLKALIADELSDMSINTEAAEATSLYSNATYGASL